MNCRENRTGIFGNRKGKSVWRKCVIVSLFLIAALLLLTERFLFSRVKEIIEPKEILVGYYSQDAFVGSGYYSTKIYEVEDNKQVFYFTGATYDSRAFLVTCFDEERKILASLHAGNNEINYYYQYPISDIPKGCKYIAFSAYIGGGTLFVVESNTGRYRDKVKDPLEAEYVHIIFYGQSLSIGADSVRVPDTLTEGVGTLGDLGQPYPALNIIKSYCQQPIISTINCFSAAVNSKKNFDHFYVAGSYGIGGNSIVQLMSAARQDEVKKEKGLNYEIKTYDPWDIFLSALDAGKEYVDGINSSISCPAIVFMQGEADYYSDKNLKDSRYAAAGDKEAYKEYMLRLKSDMQNAVMERYDQKAPPLFLIYQVSGGFVQNHTMSINMAQTEFAEENEDVILLQSPYFLPNYDSGHLTSNGYRWYGEYISKALYSELIDKKPYMTMRCKRCWIDGDTVVIEVENATLPIRFDTYITSEEKNYGFALWSDGNEIAIQEITTSGALIFLKTNVELSTAEKVEISYAGMERNGAGNVRDSNETMSEMKYIDDKSIPYNKKLTIEYIPQTQEGGSMIGKEYPLYNWLQSFYYEIEDEGD